MSSASVTKRSPRVACPTWVSHYEGMVRYLAHQEEKGRRPAAPTDRSEALVSGPV